jgi:hypothetical protein
MSVTAGPVLGWDVADDTNKNLSWTGQFAFTPLKDFSTNVTWIAGREYSFNGVGQAVNASGRRYVVD